MPGRPASSWPCETEKPQRTPFRDGSGQNVRVSCSEVGRANRRDGLLEYRHPILGCTVSLIEGDHEIDFVVTRAIEHVGIERENAQAGVVADHLPQVLEARHYELVRGPRTAGDDHPLVLRDARSRTRARGDAFQADGDGAMEDFSSRRKGY